MEVGAHRGVHGLLVDERSRVALNGGQGHDGERQEHDDGEAVDRFSRARTLEAALDVLEQRRAAKEHLHDLRAFGTDATQQQRTTNPQGKGSEDADQAFDEEVGDQTVLAAVGLQPRVAHGEHTEQEGQPVEPALGFGSGRGLANALFDLEFDELACTASTEEQRQPEGGDGGEQGGADAQGRVDVKVAGSELHEPDRRENDGHGQQRQQVADEPRHRRHDEEFQQHHALQALPVRTDDPVNADLTAALLEGEHQPVNQHGNGKEDDGNHDDVIENLNQAEEDVEEQNGPADDVGVVQLDFLVGVGTVLHLRAQVLEPFGGIGG